MLKQGQPHAKQGDGRRRFASVLLVAAMAFLGSCTRDPLAEQYAEAGGSGYISGDGAITQIPVVERGEPIVWNGESANGESLTSDSYVGEVHVINFWWAGCPPCRLEASDLRSLSEQFSEVPFVGVNTYDTSAVVTAFDNKFEIAYPSVLDARTNAVQLAFASANALAPKATPTTLVLDKSGRVAARISGLLDPSVLSELIQSALDER